MRLAREEIEDLIESKDCVKLVAVKETYIWIGKGKEEGKYVVIIKDGVTPSRTESGDKSQIVDLAYQYLRNANTIKEVQND